MTFTEIDPELETLIYCDLCGMSEVEWCIADNRLRRMYRDETDDLVVCEICLRTEDKMRK